MRTAVVAGLALLVALLDLAVIGLLGAPGPELTAAAPPVFGPTSASAVRRPDLHLVSQWGRERLARTGSSDGSMTPVVTGGWPAAIPTAPSDEPDWIDVRRDAVLTHIDHPWAWTGFTVEFRSARRGLRAVTLVPQRRIIVFARRADPAELTAFDLAHEIGHAVDIAVGTTARRDAWLRRRGAPDTAWYGCSTCDDLSTGAGDFAEVYALWEVGPIDFRSRVASAPGPHELEVLSAFFRRGDAWRRRAPAASPSPTTSSDPGEPPPSSDPPSDEEESEPSDEGSPEEEPSDDGGGPLPCVLLTC